MVTAGTRDNVALSLQDVLALGGDARMNLPGQAHGQWRWRCNWEQFKPWHAGRLRAISAAHGRNGLALEFR